MEIPTTELQRASTYRVLALLFLPPSEANKEELVTLCSELSGEQATELQVLAKEYSKELEGLYHQVLGPTGVCRDAESDFEVNALGGKGPLLADVAAFYKAFAYEYETLGSFAPDQISVELDYMAWLAFKTAYARHCDRLEDAQTCSIASNKFVKDHLGAWVRSFLARLNEASEGTYYEGVAQVALQCLERMEPGQIAAIRPDLRRGPALPVLTEQDDCCEFPEDMNTH